jgi:hypothetical protein
MRINRRVLLSVALSLPLVASSTAFASTSCSAIVGNLVSNCGFETGDFTGWSQTGNSNFTGVDNGFPNNGNFAADLGATGIFVNGVLVGPDPGFLSQTVSDTNGATTTLTFWLASLPAEPLAPVNNYFDYSIDNNPAYTVNLMNVAATSLYTEYTLSFIGTGSDTVLFTFENEPSAFELDDVAIVDPGVATVTPEPSSLMLLGTGVLSLAGVARRKFLNA